jgi:hypothetical protein
MKFLKVNLVILVCGVLFPHAILANTLSGIGFAQTNLEAKKEALADLSQVIKSEVRSSFESTAKVVGNKGSLSSSSNIKISSNLPILGAEFSYIDRALEVEAHVKLTPSKVKKLYVKKLQNLNAEIDSLLKELQNTKTSSLKQKLYEDIFSLLNEYDRYESVAIILGVDEVKRPSITKAKVKIELAKLNSQIDSLSMACGILAKRFDESKIFVYPPFLQNTTTASEFGSVFQKELQSKITLAKAPKNANFILVGEYISTKNGLVLNYELLDTKTNEVKKSKTITINPKAYKGLKVKPANIDFDKLLNSGIVISSKLKVQLNSSKGSENLLFREGEDVELFVKLNKKGYFYIVGYTQTKDGKFSYLLELQEGSGGSKFIKFVNADDASRWISLGEFSVEKPFGVESLQVIASNKKITSLPLAKYDQKSGYYVISNNIKQTLIKTRGLKKKHSKKAEFSEDVMSFTTLK